MLYEFEHTTTGERIERNFPMKDAPALDSIIEINGEQYRRVVSRPRETFGDPFKPFTSIQMPLHDPLAPHHDPRGRARFQTRREVDNYVAACKDRDALQFKY